MNNRAKTVKEVLIAAKWILENVGWCKNTLVKRNSAGKPTAFCLGGALSEVRKARWISEGAIFKVVMDNLPSEYYYFISSFNDDEKTTKRKVLNLLDRAIKKA